MSEEARAFVNTDRELYREPDTTGNGDYYSPSIHVTQGGSIGIDVGGYVFVMPLKEWHDAALIVRAAVEAERVDDLIAQLEGWKLPDTASDDRLRQIWLMKKAANALRHLSVRSAAPSPNGAS